MQAQLKMRSISSDAVAKVRRHQYAVLGTLGIVEHPVFTRLERGPANPKKKTNKKPSSPLLDSMNEQRGNVFHHAEPYGDGVFGAGVDDGLQQVVKLGDVQLSFHQQRLGLLLHGLSYGGCHLLLHWPESTTKDKCAVYERWLFGRIEILTKKNIYIY